MARKQAFQVSNKAHGAAYASGNGYKGVLRRGSKWGYKYEDGRISQNKGGFDTAEEAAYAYDEFMIAYVGPDADTNQALGLLKEKHVLAIREKLSKAEKPVNKADKRSNKVGSSGYKGVSVNQSKKFPFKAQTYVNGKYVQIGSFATPVEAARAYDAFMIMHVGVNATTNVSLGLLPPLSAANKKPAPVIQEVEDEDEPQPEFNESPIPSFQHSSAKCVEDIERENQIKAARAMGDVEEDEGKDAGASVENVESTFMEVGLNNGPHPLSVENSPTTAGEEKPAPALIPSNTEVILMSDADKLRLKAQELLQEAAIIEAGDIKRKALDRIAVLSGAVAQMQESMVKLIDTCAEIEVELKNLKELL